MKNIKTFESFTQEEMITEGLMNYIKKLPFYDKAVEVYNSLKDKIKEYLEKFPQEDLDKMRKLAVPVSENFELTLERSELVNKVLSIFGLSTAGIGLMSGLVSMIVAEINKHGEPATPWFIACVILLAVGATSHFFGQDLDDNPKKKKIVSKGRSNDLRRKGRR